MGVGTHVCHHVRDVSRAGPYELRWNSRSEARRLRSRQMDERSAGIDRLQDFLDRSDIGYGGHPMHLHLYRSESMMEARCDSLGHRPRLRPHACGDDGETIPARLAPAGV